MKLAYVVNTLGAGGAESHLLCLARDMAQRGYSVLAVILKKDIQGGARSLEPDFIEAGVKVVYLQSFALRDIGRWFSLICLLKKFRPDILHSHLPRSDLAAAIAKAIFPNILWVSTIHDRYKKGTYSGYWIFPFIRWNWSRANHFIAVSEHVRKWGIQTLKIPSGKISVIYHGISISRAHGAPLRYEIRDHLVVGCLARFEKRKGIETLVKAMVEVLKRFPKARLLLAGSDPTGYASVIKNLARSLGIESNVEVLGFCATPLDFLRSLDIFAFASITEGFGIVLIEAMAVKCPIVASNIYPINHIVQHEKTGLLANPGDPDVFAEAIIELADNQERRRKMGEAGYQRCIKEFSLEKSLNKVHDLYVDLQKKRASSQSNQHGNS